MRIGKRTWLVGASVFLCAGTLHPVQAAEPAVDPNTSPAQCGREDEPEPGMQGDLLQGETARFACGLSLVSQLPADGPVQGSGHCVYVRTEGGLYGAGSVIRVFDMRDPANPVQVGEPLPTYLQSETMRAVTTDERAVLVQGGAVYDIRDCEHPVLKGHIEWNPASPTAPLRNTAPQSIPHDIRISHDATRVYASYSTLVADISNLDDPTTWTVRDHTCVVSSQYHPVYGPAAEATGDNMLCDEVSYLTSGNPFVRGSQSHGGPEENGNGSRVYVGNQLPANDGNPEEHDATLRILDMTDGTPRILDSMEGPGHSIDWFRTADGREFLLHANEIAVAQTSCVPHPRTSAVGFTHQAYLTEVTGDELRRASMVEMAISRPENCAAKLASGQNTDVSYHSVNDRYDARIAMISFGRAGLRVIDIRDPDAAVEVAYFNHGSLNHAGVSYYDAERGLIYAPVNGGVRVLELRREIIERLGLPEPNGPALYPDGRAAPALATATGSTVWSTHASHSHEL